MNSHRIHPLLIATLLTCSGGLQATPAQDMPDAALQWLNDDSELDALAVNEGELRFLPGREHGQVLHSSTTLHINAHSLETGWVRMEQCYRELDEVPRTDIVYRYKQIEDFKITRQINIGQARVDGQIIHLEQVSHGAEVCVGARVKQLKKLDDGGFTLSQGPYHRKFLDGYYPYHVTLRVHYPENLLDPIAVKPSPRAHFQPQLNRSPLVIDTWFEGVLAIEIRLRARAQ